MNTGGLFGAKVENTDRFPVRESLDNWHKLSKHPRKEKALWEWQTHIRKRGKGHQE